MLSNNTEDTTSAPTETTKFKILNWNRTSCLSKTLNIGSSGSLIITGTEYIAKQSAILPAAIHFAPKNRTSNLSPPNAKNMMGSIDRYNDILFAFLVDSLIISGTSEFSDNSL